MSEEKVGEETVKRGSFYSRHKKLCRVLGVVVAVILLFAIFLGPIIRVCVEQVVPAAIGVPVDIGGLSVNLFTGNIGVRDIKVGDSKGLNAEHFVTIKRVDVKLYRGWAEVKDILIANPAGFKEPYILELKHARVDLEPETLTAPKLEIEEVLVTGLDLYYEPQVSGKNNIDKLQEYVIETFKITESKEAPKEAQKLQIDELRLTDIDVHTVVLGQRLTLPVVPVELDDLGEGPEGITGGEVFLAVLDKLSLGAGTAIKDSAKTLGAGTAKLFDDVGTQSKKGVDSLKNLFKSPGKK